MVKKKSNNKAKPSEIEIPRNGFNPLFLGEDVLVDLPKLSEEMAEDSTKLKDGSNVLKYVHFSIIMCQSRGLAYFTAVNIDGNTRQADVPRLRKWHYDKRISRDYQYGDEVYDDNDLDKGHLVRRLDPVWGDFEVAKQANKDSFYYTNSAPQHMKLNQKIWLGLEDYLLKNAENYGLKVSVFTGPVFRADDKVYREKYQIPADFWKVVVMVKKDGTLSATAYIQTQQDMIENLEFFFGEYKTYQVPVQQIEELTGLDFGDLYLHDPLHAIESTGLVISDEADIIV